MAMITFDGSAYQVGADFVDAVTGAALSHGFFELNGGIRYSWRSTQSQQDTESALRAAAKREGRRVTFLHSQAI